MFVIGLGGIIMGKVIKETIHANGIDNGRYFIIRILNPSNSRGLKLGLNSCSQIPRNSIVLRFRDENHIAIFAHRTSSLITGRNIETILDKEGNKPKNSEVALN